MTRSTLTMFCSTSEAERTAQLSVCVVLSTCESIRPSRPALIRPPVVTTIMAMVEANRITNEPRNSMRTASHRLHVTAGK